MISGVSNIIIPVDDQGRAKAFWTETIGFEVLVDAPYREERWIEVRSPDGVGLVLSTREEWSRLQFPQPPIRMSFGWWSMFNDTEGNRFALGQTEDDEP
jgi:catechol 2,3-dioxygenase-like lactoylglutathione lyase family enzyme